MNPIPTPPPCLPPETLLAERAWIRSLARSLVRDENRADDLEQQTLLAAIEHPPAHGASPRGWLATVMRRAAGRERRGDWRRARRQAVAIGPDAAPATADVVAQAEWHGRVVQAVLALDEPYRTTLLLRYFEDLPPRAVAARMNAPVETVRSRVQRGIAKLREAFDVKHRGDRRAWAVPLIQLAAGGSGGGGAEHVEWEQPTAPSAPVGLTLGLGASVGWLGLGARSGIAVAAGLLVVAGALASWLSSTPAREPEVLVPAALVGSIRSADDVPRLAAKPGAAADITAGSRERLSSADLGHVRNARIIGRVTRASNGSAVVGARVLATRIDDVVGPDLGPVEAASDAEGKFSMSRLEPGEYLVHATTQDGLVTRGLAASRADGYLPCAVRVEASGTATVDLLEESGVAVEGRVTGTDGAPVAGAKIVATFCAFGSLDGPRWAPTWKTVAAADGAFRFAGLVDAARYSLAAVSPGLPTCRDSIDTGDPEQRRVELQFERGWFVEVTATDAATGAAIPGLVASGLTWGHRGYDHVEVFGEPADGKLRAGPFLPRPIHLDVSAPAYLPTGADVPAPDAGTTLVQVAVKLTRATGDETRVPPELALQYRPLQVTGPDGTPVERVGYLLIVRPFVGSGASIGQGLVPGKFDLPVGGGKDRWIEIYHPQSAWNVPVAAGHARVDIPPGNGPIEVRLPAERTLAGSVVGPSGAPVPSVLVRALPVRWTTDIPRLHEASVASARTGADGRFLLRGLADETYELAIEGPAELEPVGAVHAAGGGAPLELRLKAAPAPQAPPVDTAPAGR